MFAVMSMVVNLVLSAALVVPFGVRGVAVALSVATIVEFALLVRTLAVRLDGLDARRVVDSVLRTLMATVLMAEVIAVWLALLHYAGLLDLGQKLDAGLATAGGVAIGGAVFFATTRALRSAEAEVLIQRLPLPERVRALAGG
jgi:peptidoglycan biosynthesis protein MviN/MurJ (putative lipid II flippase)